MASNYKNILEKINTTIDLIIEQLIDTIIDLLMSSTIENIVIDEFVDMIGEILQLNIIDIINGIDDCYLNTDIKMDLVDIIINRFNMKLNEFLDEFFSEILKNGRK